MKLSKRYQNSSLTRLAVYCFATGFGLILLGLGGRLVMRIIAISKGRPPVFSFEGTIIILFAGGIAGGTAGLIWAILKMCINKSWVVNGIWYVTLLSFNFVLTLPAPRNLNEPMGCKFSSFKYISAGASSIFNRTKGVRKTRPAILSFAWIISLRLGATTGVISTSTLSFMNHLSVQK